MIFMSELVTFTDWRRILLWDMEINGSWKCISSYYAILYLYLYFLTKNTEAGAVAGHLSGRYNYTVFVLCCVGPCNVL